MPRTLIGVIRIGVSWTLRCACKAALILGLIVMVVTFADQSQPPDKPPARGSELRGHSRLVTSLAFPPGGKTLLSASFDGTVRLWELATMQERAVLARKSTIPFAFACSPDGQTLALGTIDGSLELWDAGGAGRRRSLAGHRNALSAVAFSRDGAMLASTDASGFVQLWEVATGHPLATLTGHQDAVPGIAFGPNGKWVITGGRDGTIRRWATATGHELGCIKLASVESACPNRFGSTTSIHGLALAPDGQTVATCGFGQCEIFLWELPSNRWVGRLEGHDAGVGCVAFSPDGNLVASGGCDHTVRLWDWRSGRLLQTAQAHSGFVRALAFSAEGSLVASGSDDGSIQLLPVRGDLTGLRESRMAKVESR